MPEPYYKRETAYNGNGAVSVGTSSTAVLSANYDGVRRVFCNDGANVIYLRYGSAAAALNQGIRLAAGQVYVEDYYFGPVNAIAATGATVLTYVEV